MQKYLCISVPYGTLRAGQYYKVLNYGYDWVRLMAQGSPIYIPKTIIGKPYEPRHEREEE